VRIKRDASCVEGSHHTLLTGRSIEFHGAPSVVRSEDGHLAAVGAGPSCPFVDGIRCHNSASVAERHAQTILWCLRVVNRPLARRGLADSPRRRRNLGAAGAQPARASQARWPDLRPVLRVPAARAADRYERRQRRIRPRGELSFRPAAICHTIGKLASSFRGLRRRRSQRACGTRRRKAGDSR
jgi:hypothetical protein